jgi:hypothetical protein
MIYWFFQRASGLRSGHNVRVFWCLWVIFPLFEQPSNISWVLGGLPGVYLPCTSQGCISEWEVPFEAL